MRIKEEEQLHIEINCHRVKRYRINFCHNSGFKNQMEWIKLVIRKITMQYKGFFIMISTEMIDRFSKEEDLGRMDMVQMVYCLLNSRFITNKQYPRLVVYKIIRMVQVVPNQ